MQRPFEGAGVSFVFWRHRSAISDVPFPKAAKLTLRLHPEPEPSGEEYAMSDGFSIAAGNNSPSIFDCPKCKQTIDASSTTCRFCGAPVDRDIALKSAVLLAKVNRAISEANYMRTVALSLVVFFLLRLVPFFFWMGALGFFVVSVAVPVWGVIWWVRYGALECDDAELKKSRRAVLITTIVVAAVCVAFEVVPFLVGVAIGLSRAMQH
jgi:hypothetical protein